MTKKALITGGAGFIGFHLANRLLKANWEILLLDNFSRGVEDRELAALTKVSRVSTLNCDARNPELLNQLPTDFTHIFHLAAIIGVSNVLERPYAVLRDNTDMLTNMIEVASRQSALQAFVFTSTSEVYAGMRREWPMQIPTPESTPLCVGPLSNARTSYMLSKIYGEALCLHSGLPVVIVRPHNVYGPRMGLAHVIPELLQKSYALKAGESLEVFSPNHTRTFCYISDAIEFIVATATSSQCLGQQLNVGCSGPEISMEELALRVLKATSRNENTIRHGKETSGSPARRCPDMTLTMQLTGYAPKVGLEEGLARCRDWYWNVFEGRDMSAK